MIKKMSFAFTLLLLSLVVISPLYAQDEPSITIRDLKGEVLITKAGETKSQPVSEGARLSPNDKIQTGKKSSAKVVVEGAGEINLGEETTWSFKKYAMEKDKREFEAYLALGRLKAKVQKLPEGSLFEIKTPTSVAAVRGTFFGLLVYMFEQQIFTLLEVFEESVVFSNLAGDQTLDVQEGQASTANEEGQLAPPESGGAETDRAVSDAAPAPSEEEEGAEDTEGTEGEEGAEEDEETEGDEGAGEEPTEPAPVPETIQETEPGQAEFEQQTEGAQDNVTGSPAGTGTQESTGTKDMGSS